MDFYRAVKVEEYNELGRISKTYWVVQKFSRFLWVFTIWSTIGTWKYGTWLPTKLGKPITQSTPTKVLLTMLNFFTTTGKTITRQNALYLMEEAEL